ncbi:hypothetical protein [Caulobacter sp. 17J80-11]|uniref:hypothetical protein n=1 Tax=Caulobacter sp. 17J80-11 TaxID=2763502 RepID=UPI00165391D9|nr:hypothetical protein [Caulobacter sp. 17J80-11]MBC6982274.1 hypothetical protein [Caulobacter sp. 17J80-11]
MRRLGLTLAAVASLGLAVSAAYAEADKSRDDRSIGARTSGREVTREETGNESNRQGKIDDKKATERGMAEAPAVAQAAGVACTIADARFTGAGKSGSVNVQTYEISCQDGPGYVLLSKPDKSADAIECLAAKASADDAVAKGQKPGLVCTMPANADPKARLQSIAQKAGARCTVTDATWIGFSASTGNNRFEVGCSEGIGYIVDLPKGAGQVKTTDCLVASAGGYQCKFTPKSAIVAHIGALAAKTGRPCQVADARLLGATSRGTNYYEVACTGASGFVFETDATGKIGKPIDCIEASGIGGGCKLTDVSAIQSSKGAEYAKQLTAAGVNCNVEQFRFIGREGNTQREVVEFVCAGKPMGLVGFFPASGKASAIDCLRAESRALKCQLTPRASIMNALTSAMTAGGKSCTVVNYQVLGPSVGDGEVLEVACGGGEKKGYIVDLPVERAQPKQVLSCQQSASRGGDKCALPENV